MHTYCTVYSTPDEFRTLINLDNTESESPDSQFTKNKIKVKAGSHIVITPTQRTTWGYILLNQSLPLDMQSDSKQETIRLKMISWHLWLILGIHHHRHWIQKRHAPSVTLDLLGQPHHDANGRGISAMNTAGNGCLEVDQLFRNGFVKLLGDWGYEQ